MRKLGSALLALMVALTLAAPALADGNQQGVVTKTFKLTIYGTASSDDDFIVEYATPAEIASSKGLPGTVVLLCGQITSQNPPPPGTKIVNISKGDCVGNGTTYTYSVQLPKGTKLAFFWARVSKTKANSLSPFYSTPMDAKGNPTSYEEIDGPMTNTAWFRYGLGMPNTGAGGMSRSTLSLGAAAAAAMATAGYFVWRRS